MYVLLFDYDVGPELCFNTQGYYLSGKKDEISNKLKHNEGRVSEHKVGGFIKSAAQFHRQVKAVNVIIQTTSTVSESVHGETTQCTSSKFCYY